MILLIAIAPYRIVIEIIEFLLDPFDVAQSSFLSLEHIVRLIQCKTYRVLIIELPQTHMVCTISMLYEPELISMSYIVIHIIQCTSLCKHIHECPRVIRCLAIEYPFQCTWREEEFTTTVIEKKMLTVCYTKEFNNFVHSDSSYYFYINILSAKFPTG